MTANVYAKGTSVPVAKSEGELRALLEKHGADAVIAGHDHAQGRAFVAFRLKGRNVRLDVPLPKLEDFRSFKRRGSYHALRRTDIQTREAWEQACRERWRAVLLLTKAKLEAIAIGFSSVEREFMHDLLTANGETIGEMLRSGALDRVLGPMNVPLLPGPRPAGGDEMTGELVGE